MSRSATPLAIAILVSAAIGAGACGGDPVARFEARRSHYTAELSGFVVRDEPARERSTVLLDVLVRGVADPPLDLLTLDVSIADAEGAEREHRRIAVEVAGVGPGGIQMVVALDDVDYRAGDGFWVEVRAPVSAAERAEYVEYRGIE